MLAVRQIMLQEISGIVAGRCTLSAPKNARTNDATKSAPAQTLKSLVKMRMPTIKVESLVA
ncbi:MAG: hypothetical protein JWL59_233 [Chthoniobacteraceae bacterium]|nr:hypothetical protein [Chthoniobacteraceae bacterium]